MSTTGTQAVDRAAELLSRVVLADEPPVFGELVLETGLAKSTASRLLQALERHHLVHRDGDGAYAAGPLFVRYASRLEPSLELARAARPVLEAISEATGETVNLAVVSGHTVVQVAQIDSTFLLGTTNWVDVQVPAHASALGKVFYAAGVVPVPEGPMERCTSQTITEAHAFRQHLDQARVQGFAATSGELEIGLDAVAAPVYDAGGDVVAALGLSGPSHRLAQQHAQLGSLLQAHARQLSELLGHPGRKEGAA